MKKSLIAMTLALAACMAMAHGPPSQYGLDLGSAAPAIASVSSLGNDTATLAGVKSVNGITSEVLVAGITKLGPGVICSNQPVNERMLN